MAGPWEQYAVQPAAERQKAGPWERFGGVPEAETPMPALAEPTEASGGPAKGPQPKTPAPAPQGLLAGVGTAIANGATLGFSDELAGGVSGLGALIRGEDFGPAYERRRDQVRAENKAFAESNPVTNFGANLVGGVGGALASAPLAAATGIARVGTAAAQAIPGVARLTGTAIGRGALAGGSGGAVAGFGEGEGGVTERLQSAGVGAGIGAVGGGVLAGGADFAGRAGTRIWNALGLGNPQTKADRQILRALERDGITPADLAARAQAAPEPTMLPDLAGRNTIGLGAAASNTPGRAMEIADQAVQLRRLGMPDRMVQATDRGFGGGAGDDVASVRDALMTQRSANAAPLYREAFEQPLPAEALPRAAEFLADPIGQAAVQRGLRVIELEHLARGEPFIPAQYGVRRATEAEMAAAPRPYTRAAGEAEVSAPKGQSPNEPVQVAGRYVLTDAPNMRLMDAAKRGYDDIVEGFRNEVTGHLKLDQYGNAVNSTRAALRDHLAEASEPYAGALQAWSGPSSALEAMGRGRQALRMDRDVLADVFNRMGETDRDFFRLGVGRAITDASSDPAKAMGVARRLLNDRQMRGRLDTAIPDPAQRERFRAAIEREVRMAATDARVSPRAGSQTKQLDAAMGDMEAGVPPTMLMNLMTGNVKGALGSAASTLYRRGQGINSSTADALAERMFTTDPQALQGVVARLGQQYSDDLARTQGRQAVGSQVLLGTGTTVSPDPRAPRPRFAKGGRVGHADRPSLMVQMLRADTPDDAAALLAGSRGKTAGRIRDAMDAAGYDSVEALATAAKAHPPLLRVLLAPKPDPSPAPSRGLHIASLIRASAKTARTRA